MNRYSLRSYEQTATAAGCLSKAWYWDSARKGNILVKGNTEYHRHKNIVGNTYTEKIIHGLEPYSEVIACIVAKHMQLAHVEYWLVKHEEFPDVITYDCEHVSVCAEYLVPNGLQKLSAYKSIQAYYGNRHISDNWSMYKRMPINHTFLCYMLLFDAIIGNTDRHLNNWDLLWGVDANGKMHIQYAPIFDNGGSLLSLVPNDELSLDFKIGKDISKSFKDTHMRQMQLIKQSFPQFKVAYDVEKLWNDIYMEMQPILQFLTKKRAECIVKYLHNRLYFYIDMFK